MITASGKDGPIRTLNDSLIQDFNIILEHLEPRKCEYIYDSIKHSIISESDKHYSNKVRFRLVEILLKHFTYKDTK